MCVCVLCRANDGGNTLVQCCVSGFPFVTLLHLSRWSPLGSMGEPQTHIDGMWACNLLCNLSLTAIYSSALDIAQPKIDIGWERKAETPIPLADRILIARRWSTIERRSRSCAWV